jgi:type I restriction enzyme M protein
MPTSLIQQFASDAGKKAGEFFTPRKVSEVVAKLAHPKDGALICDPACGSGSLLLRAGEEVGTTNFRLYGQEANGQTRALACMNLFLHGRDDARIDWCDTLNGPTLLEGDHLMRFDVVVANPPFSLDKWGADNAEKDGYHRFVRGIPPKSKGGYAFILHMLAVALPGEGRVAVVAPHGVLFRRRRRRANPGEHRSRQPSRRRRRVAGTALSDDRHSGLRARVRPRSGGWRRART